MDFGIALGKLKNGRSVRRGAWDDNCFIFLVGGSEFKVTRGPLLDVMPEGMPVCYLPHIDFCRFDRITPWTPTSEDLLSCDWEVVCVD